MVGRDSFIKKGGIPNKCVKNLIHVGEGTKPREKITMLQTGKCILKDLAEIGAWWVGNRFKGNEYTVKTVFFQ